MTITTPTHPIDDTTSAPPREPHSRTWWHVANSAIAATAVVLAVVALTDGSDGATETPAPAPPAAASVSDRVPAYQYDLAQQARGGTVREPEELCGTRGLVPPQPC
jgi:hypothetical protein